MKKSKFNVIESTEENKKLIFNSYTGTLVELNKEYLNIFDNIENIIVEDLDEYAKEIIDNLKKCGFIVNRNEDEILKYKYLSERQRYSTKRLKIVIAPTLECNFACKYCYETPKKGAMSNRIQESLIEFVNKIIAQQKIEELSVMWYGGEPLLQVSIIESLAEKFIAICKKNNIKYSSGIITNGYILDKNAISVLLKSKVTSAQITLDGTEEYHNKKRVLLKAPNKGTFNEIINNINVITREKFFVSIRMNVDKENYKNMKDLVNNLAILLTNKDKINITFAPVFENDNTIDFNNIMTNAQFSKYYYDAMTYAIEMGFKRNEKSIYPKGKLNYCSAVAVNSYVIAPNGSVFKCWNDICNEEKRIGTLDEFLKGKNISLNSEAIKWHTYSAIDNNKCTKCNLLPICSGGCPRLKVHLSQETKCEQIKYNISNIMKYYKIKKVEGK